ncbi:hypothetical protein IWQ60_012318 [Tieghemiomyces parasiticus]|uniref:Uncharacterized protein n=1 Tax=Tieghemiomyces parasiticus TaxID=78921 RepID=A0A9W8DHP0_9FUNG|nr:hypothetical protein IWQ60_012318 [Tieghemiomyces parasiticus]
MRAPLYLTIALVALLGAITAFPVETLVGTQSSTSIQANPLTDLFSTRRQNMRSIFNLRADNNGVTNHGGEPDLPYHYNSIPQVLDAWSFIESMKKGDSDVQPPKGGSSDEAMLDDPDYYPGISQVLEADRSFETMKSDRENRPSPRSLYP